MNPHSLLVFHRFLYVVTVATHFTRNISLFSFAIASIYLKFQVFVIETFSSQVWPQIFDWFESCGLRGVLQCIQFAAPEYRSSTISTLHHTTQYHTTPHYTIPHYTTLHNIHTTLHYTLPHYTTLHNTTLHETKLHYTTTHYTKTAFKLGTK